MNRSVLLIGLCLLPLTGWAQTVSQTVYQTTSATASMTLSQAVSAALDNDPLVKASAYRRASASARARDTRSGARPQISAAAGYTRYQEPNTVIPIHTIGVFPPLDDDLFHARVQAHLSLFDGGRRAARQRAARAGVREAGAQGRAVRINLIENVATLFVQSRDLADRHQLILSRLAALDRRLEELGQLLSAGRVAAADVAMVEAAVNETHADRALVESQQQQLAIRLGRLVSAAEPVSPRIPTADTLTNLPLAVAVPNPRIDELAGGDAPQLASARARLQQAEALRQQAWRAHWPELSSFAAYNLRAGGDLDGIGEWLAGVQVSMPLFDGGHRSAAAAVAAAAERAAAEQVRLAQQQQQMEQQLAVQQWQSAMTRQQHVAAAVADKARSLAAHLEMYREGRISLSDLMNQETEHLQLQLRGRSLASERQLARLRQFAVAGTLTPDNVTGILRSAR